jgi:hypothetical protein
MRNLRIACVAGLVLFLGRAAWAQPVVLLDEYVNTFANLTGPLGAPVSDGFLFLLDPNTSAVSDQLIFFNNGSGMADSVVMESADDQGAPADVGSVDNLTSSAGYGTAQVNELPDGSATYIPTTGQPGFSSGNPGLTYQIQSDTSVPEPSTLMLSLLGGLGLLARRNRRRAA